MRWSIGRWDGWEIGRKEGWCQRKHISSKLIYYLLQWGGFFWLLCSVQIFVYNSILLTGLRFNCMVRVSLSMAVAPERRKCYSKLCTKVHIIIRCHVAILITNPCCIILPSLKDIMAIAISQMSLSFGRTGKSVLVFGWTVENQYFYSRNKFKSYMLYVMVYWFEISVKELP